LVNETKYGLGQIDLSKYKDILKINSTRQLLEIRDNIKFLNALILSQKENNIKKILSNITNENNVQEIINAYIDIEYSINM